MKKRFTSKQAGAIEILKKALNRCHKAGLKGGVYDGSFCVWPIACPDPRDYGNFFERLSECGEMIGPDEVAMTLDGGAGT